MDRKAGFMVGETPYISDNRSDRFQFQKPASHFECNEKSHHAGECEFPVRFLLTPLYGRNDAPSGNLEEARTTGPSRLVTPLVLSNSTTTFLEHFGRLRAISRKAARYDRHKRRGRYRKKIRTRAVTCGRRPQVVERIFRDSLTRPAELLRWPVEFS